MKNCIFTIEKRLHTYFVIYFDYDIDTVGFVKKIPTSIYNPKNRSWLVRVSAETSPIIQNLIENGFDCTNDVIDKIDSYKSKKELLFNLSDSFYSNYDLSDININGELYPFQKGGVKYMVSSKRCFNADDMGLGKTVQTIVAMEKANAYPHIIVCPNKMKRKWREHVHKWIPHRSSVILDDNNFYYNHDVLILNYESITKFLVIEKKDPERSTFKIREVIKRLGIKGFTADECHYLKDPKSIRTRAIKKLCADIEYIWMLSGTFVENKPSDLITQLQIMRRLNDFGGYNFFIKRYCDAKKGYGDTINKSGSSNLVELNEKLKKICMVRRMKKDVEKELKGKKRYTIPIEITNREEYNLAENDIFSWIEMKEREKYKDSLGIEIKRPDRRLTQDAIELQVLNALRVITSYGKLEFCIDWIRRFIKKEKLVVFAHHIPIQKRLIKEFPGCAKIIGGMNPTEQYKNEKRFKEDSCRLIVCSLMGAKEGLDFVSAYNYFCVEYDWKPSTHDQAEDRLNRIGQHHLVNCYYPIAIDTIDEFMFDLHEVKRKVMAGIMDGNEYNEKIDVKKELVKVLKDQRNVNFSYR